MKKTKETSREQAIKWWNDLPLFTKNSKHHYADRYFPNRGHASLTGREIEHIWKQELQEAAVRFEYRIMDDGTNYPKSTGKQFKEFNPELFKAYIDKFSDEDKLKALSLILNYIDDLSVGTRNSNGNDVNYVAAIFFSGRKEILEYRTREW